MSYEYKYRDILLNECIGYSASICELTIKADNELVAIREKLRVVCNETVLQAHKLEAKEKLNSETRERLKSSQRMNKFLARKVDHKNRIITELEVAIAELEASIENLAFDYENKSILYVFDHPFHPVLSELQNKTVKDIRLLLTNNKINKKES